MTCYKRLPLTGLVNARDLGGYPTADGRVTRYRVFVRSELPRALTEADIAFLMAYGITLAVDFRGGHEVEQIPSCLHAEPWLRYVHNPLVNADAAKGSLHVDAQQRVEQFRKVDWREVYTAMADGHPDWVRTNMELAAAESGVMLYHCTTGKDRTGIFSAMLLGLCGVSREDIIADYCISQIHLHPVYRLISRGYAGFLDAEGNPNMELAFFRTSPETMDHFLRHIDRQFGSMRAYLQHCGVRDAVLDAIIAKFVESPAL